MNAPKEFLSLTLAQAFAAWWRDRYRVECYVNPMPRTRATLKDPCVYRVRMKALSESRRVLYLTEADYREAMDRGFRASGVAP
jgi:hypothetical protein